MDKFTFIALWDTYRGLLTPLQQEITDMYFNLDLTVSEIAAEKGTTRQAVSECMKNCKKQLEEYENKLGFCRRSYEYSMEVSFKLTDAARWAVSFKKAHPELSDEAEKLIEILDKEYGEEVQSVLSDPEKIAIMNTAAVKHGLKVE